MHIELQHIVKGFNDGSKSRRLIFDDFNYSFEIGKSSTAIVGKSGSGKSTLLTLLGLINAPDAGEIKFAQQSVTSLTPEQRAEFRLKNIGFIFQDFNLVDELQLWENVALPAVTLGKSFRKTRNQALELLAQVGCEELAKRYPAEVSGGQLQRCAVARALINSPQLILADEPTGSLDPSSAEQVIDLILKAGKDTKVIMVTHDLKNAARAEQVLRLENGQLREVSRSELKAS